MLWRILSSISKILLRTSPFPPSVLAIALFASWFRVLKLCSISLKSDRSSELFFCICINCSLIFRSSKRKSSLFSMAFIFLSISLFWALSDTILSSSLRLVSNSSSFRSVIIIFSLDSVATNSCFCSPLSHVKSFSISGVSS